MQDEPKPTYKTKYKLINEYDANDFIEFESPEDEDPCSIALEKLGWFLVPVKDSDEN